MTHRERFLNIMNFEAVDRVPNYELGVWPQAVDRWYGEGLPRDAARFNWFEGEAYFGLERRAFAPIDISMQPPFEYEVLEETNRYLTARHANGVVTKALKEGTVRGGRNCMDQYIDFPVVDRESFRAIRKRYNPESPLRYPQWWDEWVRMWKTRDYPLCLLTNGTFGLYSQMRSWVGTENLSLMFFDDPALIEEMVETHVDFLLALVEKALNAVDFDYFNFFEDFAGKGGPLISPQLFRKFLLPGYKRVIEKLRSHGIRHFWLDSDGNTEAVIPLLIESGITCHWPLELASDMDPVRLRKEYGRALAFAGGIDKRELSKDKAAIGRELYARIPPMLESGGFIPHVDHTVPPEVPYANFQYYLELKDRLLSGGS
ncbi:MAG: hypothetical protein AUJ92_11995 [Armatimonadetes bacterium CG2_30_59_28]|nr:hypothetical protein [Armatimonadota bacterium]OIO93616.1 MAG: hypothetical protein AUJ92_11995 [Armatimonadetes bacterium CG2_30_59_28]PIU66269.1 MAG: hypothetical protein COS85_05320 [Armatimonadetes bacterium CG07_land_8_20_14_0_80_59_28]PIX40482.1 MAG: hypothetical protein COZ56_14610 [Armatimonadetes bacterium CG_4_8_14_3_um_filter_58_9]PIY41769.1 MAG: hypothetical protein COZ05_15175 [Armatimonadetes bacterium CG_4_10_14_3_um_filter_59_10]PJB69855.1 MAG: hypothetical protein CO095_095